MNDITKKSKNLAQVLSERGVNIPGLNMKKPASIASPENAALQVVQKPGNLPMRNPGTSVASPSGATNAGTQVLSVHSLGSNLPQTQLTVNDTNLQQAQQLMASMVELQSQNNPMSMHYIARVAKQLQACKYFFGETFKVPPYYFSGMSPLSTDSSWMFMDPDVLMSTLLNAIMNMSASDGVVTRRDQTYAQLAFNVNGVITFGGATFPQLNFLFPHVIGAPAIIGYLFQVQAANRLDGGTTIKVYATDGSTAEVPNISMQLSQNDNMGYIFLPTATRSTLLSTNQTLAVNAITGALELTDVSSESQVATDKYMIAIDAENSYPISIGGVNAIINVIPVYLDAERIAALIQSIATGDAKLIGNAIVKDAAQYFTK